MRLLHLLIVELETQGAISALLHSTRFFVELLPRGAVRGHIGSTWGSVAWGIVVRRRNTKTMASLRCGGDTMGVIEHEKGRNIWAFSMCRIPINTLSKGIKSLHVFNRLVSLSRKP